MTNKIDEGSAISIGRLDELIRNVDAEWAATPWFIRIWWAIIGKTKVLTYFFRKLAQRLKNGGFPDEHIFEMGTHLCKWVRPRLALLVKNGPDAWPQSDGFPTIESYHEALRDILYFVDCWIADLDERDRDEERYQRGKASSGMLFTYWD